MHDADARAAAQLAAAKSTTRSNYDSLPTSLKNLLINATENNTSTGAAATHPLPGILAVINCKKDNCVAEMNHLIDDTMALHNLQFSARCDQGVCFLIRHVKLTQRHPNDACLTPSSWLL